VAVAQEGELVKLGNGRWARFRQLPVYAGDVPGALTLLAAVELDDRTQEMLGAAEVSLDAYRLRGFEMDLRLDAEGNVRFEQRPALH
jgi:undecaprenyl pyrophosphate synthase